MRDVKCLKDRRFVTNREMSRADTCCLADSGDEDEDDDDDDDVDDSVNSPVVSSGWSTWPSRRAQHVHGNHVIELYIAQYHTPSITLLASLSRVPQGLTKISFCIVMENVHEVEEVAGQYQTGLFWSNYTACWRLKGQRRHTVHNQLVSRIRGFAFMRYINPRLIEWLID